MPISVLCPSCDAPVNAPDSAAGKRAKCPKCSEIMILPGGDEGFEVVEEPAPKPKPRVRVQVDDEDERPTRKSRRDDDQEAVDRPMRKSTRRVVAEVDDEDEDRPRGKSKSRSRKKAGPPMALLIGGGVALLLLVAGGLYFALGDSANGSGSTTKGGDAKGTNWVAFSSPDGSFESAFPEGAPAAEDIESLARQMGNKNAKPDEIKKAKEMMAAMGIGLTGWSRSHGDRKYVVMVMSVPAAMAKQLTPDAIMKQGRQQSEKVLNQSDFSGGGLTGKQLLVREEKRGLWQLVRFAPTASGKIIVQFVETPAELKADDADAKTFFERFQWKS